MTTAMREASCASADEWCSLASLFTKLTTSAFARSVWVCNREAVCDSACSME
eukprot:CAMPEP_0179180372 /NCGR_PEP_ID=MMETSP0796-20121207/89296_1 /TAXON_ID=73915 /ORGANISM="Pyrodinium bahamense, Strain pbaha01" /LENGTH=51 /DNA_ID=CAMNT_0020884081 /DNA_START=8 /DNA_END=163 /DNA_ORIENTATION=+